MTIQNENSKNLRKKMRKARCFDCVELENPAKTFSETVPFCFEISLSIRPGVL